MRACTARGSSPGTLTLPSGSANLASHLRPSMLCSELTALSASAASGGGWSRPTAAQARWQAGSHESKQPMARAVFLSGPNRCHSAFHQRARTCGPEGHKPKAAALARILLPHDLGFLHHPKLAKVLQQRGIVCLPRHAAAREGKWGGHVSKGRGSGGPDSLARVVGSCSTITAWQQAVQRMHAIIHGRPEKAAAGRGQRSNVRLDCVPPDDSP